jgi:hypothetical protein
MLDVIHYDTSILGVQDIEWFLGTQLNRMGDRRRRTLIDVAQVVYSCPQVLSLMLAMRLTLNYLFRNPWLRHVFLAAFSGGVFGESSTGCTWSFLHASLMAM